MTSALIQLEGVAKVYYTREVETHALDDIHLEIAQGEFIAIEGPSGCGKSTLLAILGLLEAATRGEYVLDGRPVHHLGPAERARVRNQVVGFIFQNFNLIGDLTVAENVELPLRYRGLPHSERRQLVASALEEVGIAHRASHYPVQLSGGQQQRTAVARAIAGRPRILLADEPTGNLDSTNAENVMALLKDLHNRGSTVCMVTHDPRFSRYASRTVRLFDGRLADAKNVVPEVPV